MARANGRLGGKQPKLKPSQAKDLLEPHDLGRSMRRRGVDDDLESGLTDVHSDLWRQIVRLVDGPPALPVLALLGIAAWIGGQATLANLVLDRAVQTEGLIRL